MTEFFDVLPPDEARSRWLAQISHRAGTERLRTLDALGRVTADAVMSPEALPAFQRSTVDGFAVRAADTFGASDSLPAYLRVVGEVVMGQGRIHPISIWWSASHPYRGHAASRCGCCRDGRAYPAFWR